MAKRADRFDELVTCPGCGEPARAVALDAHRAGVPCRVVSNRKLMVARGWSLIPDSACGYGGLIAKLGIVFEVGPAAYSEGTQWTQKNGGQKYEMALGIWSPTWVGVVLSSLPTRARYAPYAVLKLIMGSEELQHAVCAVWELTRQTEKDPGEVVWGMLQELRGNNG